jgi:hypothetical protein
MAVVGHCDERTLRRGGQVGDAAQVKLGEAVNLRLSGRCSSIPSSPPSSLTTTSEEPSPTQRASK